MKNDELKKELKKSGILLKGKKADFVARLQKNDER